MAFTWALSELRTEFRKLIGRSTAGDISDANCNNWINEYYLQYFPEEAGVSNFQTDFTQDVTATDSGEYSLAQTVLAVEEPVTLDGERIALYTDKEQFFDAYPEDEHFSSPPTLAIGSDTTKVGNAAFKYHISGYAYSKAATETVLSGDAVPANKYGAWVLSIDADGTITVTEADDNATGYNSPCLAIEGLPDIAADEAVMGFVTVKHTSTFTPGTTGLDTDGVEDTYTDGRPELRNQPEAALIAGNKLYLRPRPDDWYRFESQLSLQRPSALSGDSSVVTDVKWGKCIATGAALLYLEDNERDTDTVLELAAIKKALLSSIKTKRIIQWTRDQRVCQPSY